MKRYLLGIVLLLFFSGFISIQAQTLAQIDLPVTFQDSTVDYTLTDFEGASTVLGTDPNDSTNTIAITTKTAGSPNYAGTTIGTNNGFLNAIPFTAEETLMSVLVYSPKVGIEVRLKAEDHTDNTLTAETGTLTKVVGWQKLVFDFSQVSTGTNPFNLSTNFDMLSIFFDYQNEGADDVYYFDEVRFGEGTPGSVVTLSDLQVDNVAIEGFSSEVYSYTVELDSGTTVVPTVTATLTDTAGTVKIQPAESIPGTTTVSITGVDGFTRSLYSISFTLPAANFPPLSLPIDFEEGPYDFVDFDGGVANVISNPEPSGINTSARVAKIVKGDGAPWAGSKLILEEKLDFSENNSFSMKVFSPRADMPILLKLETTNGAEPDNIVNTTKANEWETVVWNYSDAANNTYEQIVFMFDIGTVGNGSEDFTFLFDDVIFFNDANAKSRIDLPVTFEETNIDYTLTDFEGASTVLGEDPTDASNSVAITTKTSGSPNYAGTTVSTEFGFASRIPFSAEETKMTVRVYSPKANINVRLKVEDHNNNTLTAETDARVTLANTWELIEFDFSEVATGTNPFNVNTNFDMASIFFDYESGGDDSVYYWDDLTFGPIGTSNEDETDFATPTKTELIGSYPNPFNPSTNIQYQLDGAQNIEITIFNITGQKIETLFSGQQNSGMHLMQWNATRYASGVYFVRLISNSGMSTIKLMLQK
ncbi:MAG: hypothetical protein BalsKO_00920 [Balneolaceae bacterium]